MHRMKDRTEMDLNSKGILALVVLLREMTYPEIEDASISKFDRLFK